MRRRISSTFTFIPKFVAPIVWLVGLGVILFASGITILHFMVWTIGAVGLISFGLPLKTVDLEEAHLILSSFKKTTRVPLLDIENVTNNHFFIHTVNISFKNPTKFGTDIIFMPKILMIFFPFMSHPIVAELKKLSMDKNT